jgi:hypothetical protein
MDDTVWRRFGRDHDKPCKRPTVLTCAMWECQKANHCRWSEVEQRQVPLADYHRGKALMASEPAKTDGLHCVYGKCQGIPYSDRPCHPGCYFQMSSRLKLIYSAPGTDPDETARIANRIDL